MGGDASVLVEEFDGGVGQADLDGLVDEVKGDAVVVFVHDHVVINVDLRLGPGGQDEGRGRQRQEGGFVQRLEPAVARAFQLLEGLGVELVQARAQWLG